MSEVPAGPAAGASGVVLDASALLALLRGEAGEEVVAEALAGGAWISAVNWSEVLAKLAEVGIPTERALAELINRGVLGQALQIAPFEEVAALLTAQLREPTRGRGLSLGDRACLALAQHKQRPALTADRSWRELEVGVEIRLIR